MLNKKNISTERLQIRIPKELKSELENVVKQNIVGMGNSKSLMVSMALIHLFQSMETTPIDVIYLNTYIPYINESGDD